MSCNILGFEDAQVMEFDRLTADIGRHEPEVKVVIPSSRHSSGQCWWPPGAFAYSTLEKSNEVSELCYMGLL
uniref:Uncharacterized protein n=1 Tax=Daphnia galeata TaxID=27404 RepID=A0A8J2RN81_9CRUS|nr:unnamed protein product [Daphnia galeata]